MGVNLLISNTPSYAQTIRPIFTEFCGKVAHGPPKKRLDLGGNLDHVMLGLRLR